MTVFDDAFAIVVGAEGGLSMDPNDTGNWTGQGRTGELKGTKFGISALSYPDLDIKDMTVSDAKTIYRRDYWIKIQGDQLPPQLAIVAFDASVLNGVGRAGLWLQEAAGTKQDGVVGPATIAAIANGNVASIVTEFHAQRICYMGGLPMWKTYGLGWSRRLVTVLTKSCQPTTQTPDDPTSILQRIAEMSETIQTALAALEAQAKETAAAFVAELAALEAKIVPVDETANIAAIDAVTATLKAAAPVAPVAPAV